MDEWKTLSLSKRHGWKSTPGYCICVLDRGAVRFDFPCDWKVHRDDDAVRIRDVEEPDDNCVLAVSRMRLPSEALLVPLRELVRMCTGQEEHPVLERKKIVETTRPDGVEIAWAEARCLDKNDQREFIARLAIGRGSGILCLITFDYWVDQASQFQSAWNELMRSLDFALPVTDPTIGPVIQ